MKKSKNKNNRAQKKGCTPGRKAKFLTKNKSLDLRGEYFMRSFTFLVFYSRYKKK